MLLTLIEKMIDSYFASIPRVKPGQEDADKALIIAHRGAHNNAQGIIENTDAAFALAKEVGCWGIELDIHATADGVLVVNHDPDLKRLWGHDAKIANLSFKELRDIEPGIPLLSEVVVKYGKTMHLFIELKIPLHDERALLNDLQGLLPVVDYHLISLDASIFNSLTQFPKESLLLVAVHNNVKKFCDLSIKEHYGGVLGSYVLFTNQKIGLLKSAQKAYGVGFVNSKYNLYRELRRGIHWIFTNHASDVSRHLQRLQNK